MNPTFFAVVNPAAGGGRCGKLASAALGLLHESGVPLEVAQTSRPGEGAGLARAAYARGFRKFLAVGGDGTSFEILNGIFPAALSESQHPVLAFLPLGTGNSFLRDFPSPDSTGRRSSQNALAALKRAPRPCDVLRLRHAAGEIHYINMLNLGFAADAGDLANRRFKSWGTTGYVAGVLGRLAALRCQPFPHRLDSGEWDRRPSLFLAFGNTKFTGGNMLIAPNADCADGRIEYVRWAPIGRLRLLWNFPRLFMGTHIHHPLASRAATRRVEFDLPGPVNAIVDGEVLSLQCQSIEVLPGALEVVV